MVISVVDCLMVIGPPPPRPPPPPPAPPRPPPPPPPPPPRWGGGSLFAASSVQVPEKSGFAWASAAYGSTSAAAIVNARTRFIYPPRRDWGRRQGRQNDTERAPAPRPSQTFHTSRGTHAAKGWGANAAKCW